MYDISDEPGAESAPSWGFEPPIQPAAELDLAICRRQPLQDSRQPITPVSPTFEGEHYTAELAHDLAARYGYSADDIRLGNGRANHVALAGDKLVVKVPKDNEPWRLESLEAEQANLKRIENIGFGPVATPRLVTYSADPAFLVATQVPGQASVPIEVIKNLDPQLRDRLGRQIGAQIIQQTTAIDLTSAGQPQPRSSESRWTEIFDQYIGDFSDPSHPILSGMAQHLYEQWQSYLQTERSKYFIHADFTLGNMALSDEYELRGLFDFARAGAGTLAEELSTLPLIDETVLSGCLRELEAVGLAPATEEIWLWRQLKDLYVLPYWIVRNKTDMPIYAEIREVITARYPHLDWSELYS